MRRIVQYAILVVVLVSTLTLVCFAHGGKTDSSGGHYNHSTGEYHYHHGYSAHDHYDMDGDGNKDCPYNFDDQTNRDSGNSYDSYTTRRTTTTVTTTTTTATQKDGGKFNAWILIPIAVLVFVYLPLIKAIICAAFKFIKKGCIRVVEFIKESSAMQYILPTLIFVVVFLVLFGLFYIVSLFDDGTSHSAHNETPPTIGTLPEYEMPEIEIPELEYITY